MWMSALCVYDANLTPERNANQFYFNRFLSYFCFFVISLPFFGAFHGAQCSKSALHSIYNEQRHHCTCHTYVKHSVKSSKETHVDFSLQFIREDLFIYHLNSMSDFNIQKVRECAMRWSHQLECENITMFRFTFTLCDI